MAQVHIHEAPQHGTTTGYTPSIQTPTDSRFVVINDNCILSIDAVLSVTSIGKVLSSRGHELYTIYNGSGGTICQFEGTGLMQRTIVQIDEIQKRNGARMKEMDNSPLETRTRIEAMERMVDSMWFMPGMPGARQAEQDFTARQDSLLQESHTEHESASTSETAGTGS